MAAEPLQEGTLLNDRYRIIRVLGRGGMGTVYMAEHVRLNAIVAVKEVHGGSGDEDQDRLDLDRCEHEARFLVRLNHPHLPRVTDAFIENDSFYLVMEYIEGVTLEATLRSLNGDPVEVARVIDWGLQIADVLSYLHSQDPPIIFRDVKPANVMLQPDGEIRVIDFGIARRFQPNANKDTALLGSVGYSPPEQFGKHQTDTRSDVYAFGATLHHLLTGHDPAAQPFKFSPARSLNPNVPESLSKLLSACLAMEPSARPAGFHEVSRSLIAAREELVAMAVAAKASHGVGTGSGRKIISSKLAQAEARQHRSSGSLRFGFVALAVLVVTGSGTYALLNARAPRRHRSRPSPGVVAVVTPEVLPAVQPSSAPRDSAQTPSPLPPTDSSSVGASVERVALEQGSYLLPVTIHGMLRGHAGSTATVAVFVYAADGSPLLSTDRYSAYANPDGQLSAATKIGVTADIQPFKVTLNLPLHQFPLHALETNNKVRGLVIVDGQSFYSDMIDLAVPVFTDPSANPAGPITDPSGTGDNTGASSGSGAVNPGAGGVSGGRVPNGSGVITGGQ